MQKELSLFYAIYKTGVFTKNFPQQRHLENIGDFSVAPRYLSPLWNEQLRVLGRESLLLDDFWDDNVYLVTRYHFEMEILLSYFHVSNPDSYFRLIEELPSGISVFKLIDSTAITEY